MNVKFMTMSQCKRIIDADFVGEHDRKGKQVDYVDYRQEILAHYWSLKDRAHMYPGDRPDVILEPFTTDHNEITIAVNRAFKPWRNIAFQIEMRII